MSCLAYVRVISCLYEIGFDVVAFPLIQPYWLPAASTIFFLPSSCLYMCSRSEDVQARSSVSETEELVLVQKQLHA